MKRKTKLIVGGIAVAAVVGSGAALAGAASRDTDQPLVGSQLDRATAAALQHLGGGTVTETEVGDDGAAYSVEVRLDDGRQVEVQLDENFVVTGTENDDDGSKDQTSADG